MPRRRRHLTILEIPAELGVITPRSKTTLLGHASLSEPTAELEPASATRAAAPWTEEVYISPSGRIFLPPGFDLERERPRAQTRPSAGPPPSRSASDLPRPRSRVVTRESWVVPEHLAPS